jgi:phage terminase large subunit
MELNLKGTNVFDRNYNAKTRFVVNQGGTGSSKTYSLAQLFVILPLEVTGKVFSIVRKSMPSLRATAMRDFLNILQEQNLYSESNHDKTNGIYRLHGNEIEFFGLDQPQKVRSIRRDYLWLNEANEMSLESFRQLNMRTNTKVYMDYNPSDEFHWIYENVLTRKDCTFIKSTYLDNPFLSPDVIKEIEHYRQIDPNYWNIYGLGERGVSQVRIYNHWELVDSLPTREVEENGKMKNVFNGEHIYGLDFGYNHPTSLCEVVLKDDDVYTGEVIYESYLTNQELIKKMEDLDISKKDYIFADSAEPQRIEEIKKAGYNIRPADKDVSKGIDSIKSRKLFVTKESVNAQKELKSYSWKVKNEVVLDEPVKIRDDFCDSLRYAVHSFDNKPRKARAFSNKPSIF